MKKLLLILTLFISTNTNAQFFNDLYKDFLKYSTVYGAGDISNSIEASESVYFVRTGDSGSLYDIPVVIDDTPDYPFDYTYGFGIRKLARFDYERKPKNFYDGTEKQLAFSAPTSAFKGLEYQFHYERERWRGELFKNHRFFVKHTGKYHIVKVESREVGKINLDYQSAEIRARLPIGKNFSISADATTGEEVSDWIWKDENGEIVAHTDLEFREEVFTELMNRYNQERWNGLESFAEIAPIIGFDYYYYKNDFWLHAYGNYILPYHKYIQGDKDISYLNRNNWGKGGLRGDAEPEQWKDYSAGVNLGWKINKRLGVFIEGEYSKMWDSELYNTSFGLNYTLK